MRPTPWPADVVTLQQKILHATAKMVDMAAEPDRWNPIHQFKYDVIEDHGVHVAFSERVLAALHGPHRPFYDGIVHVVPMSTAPGRYSSDIIVWHPMTIQRPKNVNIVGLSHPSPPRRSTGPFRRLVIADVDFEETDDRGCRDNGFVFPSKHVPGKWTLDGFGYGTPFDHLANDPNGALRIDGVWLSKM